MVSVRLSVPAINCCISVWQVCCCGLSGQEISLDCCMSGTQQQRRRSSMVVGIKGEQCQVSSHRRRLNRLAWEADDGISSSLKSPKSTGR